MKSRKLGIGVLALILAGSLIATGAVITMFGSVTTTATVEQSIVIREPGETWLNYNDVPIDRTIDPMIHCTDYCYKAWIWNRAYCDIDVSLPVEWVAAPQGDSTGFDVNQFIFGEEQTIRLVQKDVEWGNAPWDEIPDGKEAYLTFDTCEKKFTWEIETESNLDDYSLIYYENHPDYWEGTPVNVIADLSSGYSGAVDMPSMPYADDENALRPISDIEEDYEHEFGAKFWLVPTDAIANGDIDWESADKILFETDLGFYMDCNDIHPESVPCVWEEFNLLDGMDVTLKADTVYCWITCNHVASNIKPGTYKYRQAVEPVLSG